MKRTQNDKIPKSITKNPEPPEIKPNQNPNLPRFRNPPPPPEPRVVSEGKRPKAPEPKPRDLTSIKYNENNPWFMVSIVLTAILAVLIYINL